MSRRAAIAAALALVAAAAACSIALDPPIEPAPAPGADASSETGIPIDSGEAGSPDGGPVRCTGDFQCRSDNPCVTSSRCDLGTGRCVYELCENDAGACTVDRCDPETNACVDRVDLAATPIVKTFKIPTSKAFAQLRCGSPSRCVAMAYPYMFASLDDVVLAYGIADAHPAALPRVLAVDGLRAAGKPVRPTALVASGTRVYFVGEIQPDLSLPIGWIDVPSDPFATNLQARTFILPSILSGTITALPGEGGDLILVVNAGANRQTYRVSTAGALVGAPRNGSGSARSVATSGARVVLAELGKDGVAIGLEPMPPFTSPVIDAGSIGFEAGAGSALAAQTYASDERGQVLVASAYGDDAGVQRVLLARALSGGDGTKATGEPHADLATYAAPPALARVVGPAVWTAPDLAVASALVDEPTQSQLAASVVHVATDGSLTVDPPRWVLEAATAGPDGGVATNPTSATMLTARGLVYWVWQRGADTTVSVLAPSCQ